MYLTLGKTYLTADGRHYTISTIDQLKNHNFAAYENYMKNHYHTDYNIIGIDNGPVCEWQNFNCDGNTRNYNEQFRIVSEIPEVPAKFINTNANSIGIKSVTKTITTFTNSKGKEVKVVDKDTKQINCNVSLSSISSENFLEWMEIFKEVEKFLNIKEEK